VSVLVVAFGLQAGAENLSILTYNVGLQKALGRSTFTESLARKGVLEVTLEHLRRGGALPAILLGDFNVGPGYVGAAYGRIAGAAGLVEAEAES
jgi:hypothetical protein